MKPAIKMAPLDRLGKPIEVGAFCAYILHHDDVSRTNTSFSGANLFFGRVTSVGRTGKVRCTNVKLHATDKILEKEIKHSCLVMQLDERMSILDQLMLLKLAS